MRIDAFHLFFDLRGPAIAFNSAGAIWFNLRFYLSWHDEQVRQGVLEPALLSNYVSLLPASCMLWFLIKIIVLLG